MKKSLPQFIFSKIPESSRQALLAIIHREANEYLNQPGVAEKFKQWKAAKTAVMAKKHLQN